MKNMLPNFNLSIFKFSQPIFGHFLGTLIHRGAQKMTKDWLRKFKNIKIEI
jgi:hypothetical protein